MKENPFGIFQVSGQFDNLLWLIKKTPIETSRNTEMVKYQGRIW